MNDEAKVEKKEIDTEIKKLKKKRKDAIKNGHEKFSGEKFVEGTFSMLNPVEWVKTLKEIGILDIRKWVIYAIILGGLYGYGYFKGIQNKPVHLDMRGKEVHIALNEHYLHILKDGSAQVEDKKGIVLKKIAVKDIPELRKALKPMGIDIKPFFTAGGGLGSKSGAGLEAGAGISVLKFYKLHLNGFLTNKGIYVGPDYQLTGNFSIISGVGKGYNGDTRGYVGGKWKF